MSEWAQKRFWTKVSVEEAADGFDVLLDGRGVKTPAKAPLRVPARALAEAIASEWEAQVDIVDPTTMPFTRMSNSAIDRVSPQMTEVADMLADYGDSDLLCYRAEHPVELVNRQSDTWDPMLEWAATTFGARLEPRTGLIHAPQDARAVARLSREVHAMSAFELAPFHDLVSLTGSLVLGLAAARDARPPAGIWEMSRLDESWQAEQWGADEEADAVAAIKRSEFLRAATAFSWVSAGRV